MVKDIVENVSAGFVGEQVIPSGDVISLAPVDFPLSENGKARLNSEVDLVVLTESITGRDVSNEIPVIQTTDVPWQCGFKTLDSIHSAC